MTCWTRLEKSWAWMWTYLPKVAINDAHEIRIRTATSFFPPLADISTFLLIVLQCLWTWTFVAYDLRKGVTYDVTNVVKILSATLGFILPLQLNSALKKNATCLNAYNTCTGNLIALCWDIIAFYPKGPDEAIANGNIKRSLNVIGAMPALIKHTFRGTIELSKSTTIKTTNNKEMFLKDCVGGKEVCTLYYKMYVDNKSGGMTAVDLCFYKLLDYIKDLTKKEKDKTRAVLVKSWERAYRTWGNMSNLHAYAPPTIFTYVLNVGLLLYSILLPFTLVTDDNGYHAIWMVAIVGYFFLGLNIAGRKVSNAFAEDAVGYQTVTNSQKKASTSVQQIYDTILLVVVDDESIDSKLVFV